MAGVAVQNIGSGQIKPGETHHWWWNNAPDGRVWWFSVDVRSPKYQILFAPYTMQVEVSRVEYRNHFVSQADQEREIHVWVKNNSDTWEAVYDLRMAFAPAGGSTLAGVSVKPYSTIPMGAAADASYSFVNVQEFTPPRKLIAFPVLQQVVDLPYPEGLWPLEADAWISGFVDGGKMQTGIFPSISGTAVSKIAWSLFGRNSMNNPLRVILFLD